MKTDHAMLRGRVLICGRFLAFRIPSRLHTPQAEACAWAWASRVAITVRFGAPRLKLTSALRGNPPRTNDPPCSPSFWSLQLRALGELENDSPMTMRGDSKNGTPLVRISYQAPSFKASPWGYPPPELPEEKLYRTHVASPKN